MCLLTFFSCMNSEKQQDLHAGPGHHGGIGLCEQLILESTVCDQHRAVDSTVAWLFISPVSFHH